MSCSNNCGNCCECTNCTECPEIPGSGECTKHTNLKCSYYSGPDIPCLNITVSDTGDDVINKIADKVCELDEAIINPEDRDKMVRISSTDTTSGYLQTKLIAGAGITLTKNNSSVNETLTASINVNTLPPGTGLTTPLVVTSSDNSIIYTQSGALNHTVDLKVNLGGDDGLPDAICEGEGNDVVCECEPNVFVCVGDGGIIFNETPFAAIAGSGIKIVSGGNKGHAPTISLDFSNTDNPDGPPDAECDEDGENCECPPGVLVCIDGDGNLIFDMPNLQEVTDKGEITTNPIQVASIGIGKYPTEPIDVIHDDGKFQFNGHQLIVEDVDGNTWVGGSAGLEHQFGLDNIAIGRGSQIGSGVSGQGGSNRISIGQASAATVIGNNGVYIGRYSGLVTDGDNNTMLGYLSGATTFTNNSTLIGTNSRSGNVAATGEINNSKFQVGSAIIEGLTSLIDEAGFSVGERIAVEISFSEVHVGGSPLLNNAGQFKAVVLPDGDSISMLYNGEFTLAPTGTTIVKFFEKTTNTVVVGNDGYADRSDQVALGNTSSTQLKINNVRFNTQIAPTSNQIPIWDAINGEYRPGSFGEADPNPLDKTITLNEGANISITGTPTQSLDDNPEWTISANVEVSEDAGQAIQVRNNGLFVQNFLDTYKVKVNSTDAPGYLSEQIGEGLDPLGIVSISISVLNGKLIITPSIDIAALCEALQTEGCVCSGADAPEVELI